jgi:chaperonin GroEL
MARKTMQRVVFQPQTYQGMMHGLNQMVKAISPTLGPLPRVVAMDSLTFGSQTPEFFDNGGSIARRIIQLADRDADMGAMFLREVLWRLQEQVGDGTATAAVLFDSIFKNGVRYISAGGNASILQKHLLQGLNLIMEELKRQTFPVRGKEKLSRVAEAVCYDPEMSLYMGEIFDIIGEYGRIEIRAGQRRGIEREYVEGMYWDWGVHSTSTLQANGGKRMEMENVAIVISDLEIKDPSQLFPPIAMAIEAGVPALLVIAEHLSENVIGFLMMNSGHEKIKIAAVKTPGWDREQKASALTDLSVLTGGKPFIAQAGDTFARFHESCFGYARRAWADTTNFGIIAGKGNPRELRRHISILRSAFAHSDDLVQRDRLRERIGKLMGGSATLKLGGVTEADVNARVELAQRTAAAMRGALMEGILPGGGIALLACRPALEKRRKTSQDDEERAAYQILLQAVERPFRTILSNAGHDPGAGLADVELEGPGSGFDVKSGKVINMVKSGIFDPANVQLAAVYAGIESGALALTVDVLVHHVKPEKADLPETARRKQI